LGRGAVRAARYAYQRQIYAGHFLYNANLRQLEAALWQAEQACELPAHSETISTIIDTTDLTYQPSCATPTADACAADCDLSAVEVTAQAKSHKADAAQYRCDTVSTTGVPTVTSSQRFVLADSESELTMRTWRCPNCGQQHFSDTPPDMCDYCRDFTTWELCPSQKVIDAAASVQMNDPVILWSLELGAVVHITDENGKLKPLFGEGQKPIRPPYRPPTK
jgi:uncharacterized membrane protein